VTDDTPRLTPDPFDRETVRLTRPTADATPSSDRPYDLVVIGGGTAGLVSAGIGGTLGFRTALIERNMTGGDCLLYGCVPSKAILRAAHVADEVRHAAEYAVQTGGDVRVDFPEAMRRMRGLRARISHHDAVQPYAEKYGVDVLRGEARFDGPRSIRVGDQTIRFHRAIIATGSRPRTIDISGLDHERLLTNETLFDLTVLPPRLAILGGGPIGCEMAQAFARLGADGTRIQKRDELLPREEPEARRLALESLRRDGVDVRLRATIEHATPANEDPGLTLHGDGLDARGAQPVIVDRVLLAVGREPATEALAAEKAGVEIDRRGVRVDDHLRTGNRRVFAAGDVCLNDRYTHAANASARVAVQNALLGPTRRWSRQLVPHVTYLDPEIAQVGTTLQEAESQGRRVRARYASVGEVDRAITDGRTDGFALIVTPDRSERILGATIVDAHAGELINIVTTAMRGGVTLKDLSEVIRPYPTRAEVLSKLADEAATRAIKPWMKRALRAWFALRR